MVVVAAVVEVVFGMTEYAYMVKKGFRGEKRDRDRSIKGLGLREIDVNC